MLVPGHHLDTGTSRTKRLTEVSFLAIIQRNLAGSFSALLKLK
jgi:hypothetical protein